MAGVIPIIGMGIDIGICAAIGIGICIAVGIRIVAFMIFSWVVAAVGLLGWATGFAARLFCFPGSHYSLQAPDINT